MTDPYSVLGVSSGANDDEIKKAYRSMCKKYHPDLNPDDAAAEEKFKEVQAAYSQIMDIRQGKSSPNAAYGYSGNRTYNQGGRYQQYEYQDPFGFGFDPFEGFGFGGAYNQQRTSGSAQQESPAMQAARNYINNRRYREAVTALSSVPMADRSARWYYYSALANLGLGNRINALESIKQAVAMDPGNSEYQALLNQLQTGAQSYRTTSQTYAAPGFSMGRLCISMWLLNLICNCLCGGRIC